MDSLRGGRSEGWHQKRCSLYSKLKYIKNIGSVDTMFIHRSGGQRVSDICVSVIIIICAEVQSLLWFSESPTIFSCANSKLMGGVFGKICSRLSVRRKIRGNC